MAQEKLAKRPRTSERRKIAFSTRVAEAQAVRITGDFTKWSTDGIPLEKGTGGEWKASLELSPGSYQYRLLVDGRWQDDPEARNRVSNPYGSENAVLNVL